jgi:teichuronic acid biosynthesis glycosyltransferase TuaG
MTVDAWAEPPQVSVIVPAYNAERYLLETLDSLLAQQGVALEVIVVDDRSSDGTREAVMRRAAGDSRLRCISTPANCGGPAGPRNLGVEQARAEWIAFCDADDVWHPQKLAVQLAAARRTGADLVCTAIEDFPDGTLPALLARPLPAVLPQSALALAPMMLKNRIATSSVLCRRKLVRAAGGFDTDRRLVAVEDYDLWLRILARPRVIALRIGHPLVAYRRLAGSISANKGKQAMKVLRVLRRASELQGWGWAFPLAAPLLLACYGGMSVYWRVFRGQL